MIFWVFIVGECMSTEDCISFNIYKNNKHIIYSPSGFINVLFKTIILIL